MHRIFSALGIFLVAAPWAVAQAPVAPAPMPPGANSQLPAPDPLRQPAAGPLPMDQKPVQNMAPQAAGPVQPPAGNLQVIPVPQRPVPLADGATVSPGLLGLFFEMGATPAVPRNWASVDYLMWWFKDAPVPVPLVTTSNAADGGIIGRPSTQVLFGNQSLDAGTLSGVRLKLGHWFDDNEIVGIEASGFFFAARDFTNYSAHSNNPNQILAVPYTDPVTGPAAFIISGTNPINGAPVVGSVTASSSSSLWGVEVNGLLNLVRNENLQVSFLGGFRHVNLQESLNMDYVVGLGPGAGAGSFYNATLADQFGTSNQFYGGQFGLKAEFTRGMFFASALGKIALGVNHQTININGQFSDPNASFYSTYGAGAGGLFTQRSNIGSYTSNPFTVVPELQLKVGVNLFSNLQVFVGYDFLYLSQAVRPGDQIDTVVNPTQAGPNPAGGGTAAPLSGPARPMPLFVESSFWAQGVSFGLQFTF